MKVKKNVLIITALTAIVTACFSPWTGDGTLTLYLGDSGENSLAAYSGINRSVGYAPGDAGSGLEVSDLSFIIHLSGPGGNRTETVGGTSTVQIALAAGSWNIAVEAYYQEILYAVSDPLTVNIGNGNNSAAVTLRPATRALNDEDFGPGATVEYRYFTASDSATALQTYLGSKAGTPGNYAVIVEGTQHIIQGNVLNINGTNVKLSLRGSGTVTLGATNGSMFNLDATGSGNNLILRGPKLLGRTTNDTPLVQVSSGKFVMHTGEIRDNRSTRATGSGGVHISGADFEMYGGEITNNRTNADGGGVYISSGTFTMWGGTISSNNAPPASNGGGGVYIANFGSFNYTVPQSSIHSNTASTSNPNVYSFGLINGSSGGDW